MQHWHIPSRIGNSSDSAASWDEVHNILERAVKRGLERRKAEPVSHMGVDEKAFRKGHSYLTRVNDLIRQAAVRGLVVLQLSRCVGW